jgi:CheY-like chemotaxis protein
MGDSMENNRILVVDDSSCFRTLMTHVLDSCGYQVATAEDGSDVLPKMAAFQPNLVLMDVEMPVLDGFEACRRIKAGQATRNIPVLMVSANRDADEGAAAAGADDFMAKPFCLDDLLSKIKLLTTLDAPLSSRAVGSFA